MNPLDLLIELAHTTTYQPELNNLLEKQHRNIQQAFLAGDSHLLKQTLKQKDEYFANERTVADISL